jgi:hypothetical protein
MNQNKIANAFNKYFLSVSDSIISDTNGNRSACITNPITFSADVLNRPFTKMSWQYATTHEMEKIIKSLKTKDTSGSNEISSRILKLSAPFIISPLTYICNAILGTGVFPDRLKFAIVRPCFKKVTYKKSLTTGPYCY